MSGSLSTGTLAILALVGALGMASIAQAQTAACMSPDPNDWPTPARPYFLVIADTSGSMTACTNPPSSYPTTCAAFSPLNSCGLVPTRYNDLKCALQKTVSAYSGLARFGMSTFATFLGSCTNSVCVPDCVASGGTCNSESYGCSLNPVPGDVTGCGPGSGATREGSILRVPIARDHVGTTNQESSNALDLLGWVDGHCGGDAELHAAGPTPLNGALRDAKRYFETGLTNPVTSTFHPSPLDASDRACRSVNVILITDGDETCDSQADAVDAASELFANGVTVGSNTYAIRTHVINFAGGTQANTDAIAAAGGTGGSLFASNEVQLAQAISNVVAGNQGSEACDNIDNDCNGCIDEGFEHFANVSQACCAWATENERDQCLSNYLASVPGNPPDGDVTLLPCTSVAQQADPGAWLCYDPGEACDGVDNNGLQGIDEGLLRCGDPLHCPRAEVCNGEDDDCDGQVDEDNICGGCVVSPEVCDGCDNDCDGVIDNGSFASISCGLASPPQCGDVRSCALPQIAPSPGACLAGAGYGSCNTAPQPEVADGIDNDCNGAVDDGLPSMECELAGTPAGLVYDGDSQCRRGEQFFGQPCLGFVGPTADVTDGVDNDCDGIIDNFNPFAPGVPLNGPIAVLVLGFALIAMGSQRLRSR